MKIAILYPPFKKKNEYPLLAQNRQFKYSASREVRIFPVVMGTLATMLKNNEHDVLFLDGINRRMRNNEFETELNAFKPDVIVLETKAPIVYDHWAFIDEQKKKRPELKTILVGDHVSFFPKESFKRSAVDFVVVGGYYDFIIRDLIEALSKNRARAAYPGGIYYRKRKDIESTGKQARYDLADIPVIDRVLCRWKDYGEAYLYKPCAYILSGRGCGRADGKAGVCTFCIWQHSLWKCSARLRPVEKVVEEIKYLVEEFGVKEVFDDNEGGFCYDEGYTANFYHEMLRQGLIGKVKISMNARADSLSEKTCLLMKKIGVRLLKIGVESANDETLMRIQKMETAAEIEKGVRRAKEYGFRVLLTNMVGYPWETEEDTKRSYERLKKLMLYKTRFGDSLQASIVVAYPGTPLHAEAKKNGWLNVDPTDYRNYDMTHDILKPQITTAEWCRKFWAIQSNPLFLLRSLFTIRSFADVKLALTGAKSLLGHLRDY